MRGQVQARETAGFDLVEHLPQGVQALLPHVAAHPLERLDLEVALDASVPLGRGADVGLPADPGQQRLGGGALVPRHGPSPGAERRCERRRVAGDRSETPFHEVGGSRQERRGVALRDFALGQNVFLQGVEPVVEDGSEGALLCVRRRKTFGQPAVHGFETVQRRLRFRDLHLGRGEPFAFRALLQPAHEEGLAAAVLAAHRLELRTPRGDGCQLFAHHGLERLQADRERVEAAPRGGAAP